MKLRVYKGTILAAALDYGQEPVYYGEPGQQVKALVERLDAGDEPRLDDARRQGTLDDPGQEPDGVGGAELTAHGFLIVRTEIPYLDHASTS